MVSKSALDEIGERLGDLSGYHRLLLKHWPRLNNGEKREIEAFLSGKTDDVATLARNLATLLKQNGIEVLDED